ncbi:MAG: hypothetical protein FWD05_05425 [Oscillospiraceae bacterium]|nr:hypothetical protein [Oscillospiraceae bacterium]
MIWIKANKTKLYRLVAEYIYLPKMKYTSFIEAPDRSTYCLEWYTTVGVYYRAYYTFVDDNPRVTIQYKSEQTNSYVNHIVDIPDITNLINKGMMKGVRNEHQLKNTAMSQQFLSSSV